MPIKIAPERKSILLLFYVDSFPQVNMGRICFFTNKALKSYLTSYVFIIIKQFKL